MKRFLFSVCALAAIVVGCSKSEVLNRPNAEVPIKFNPYTGRIPVTKGAAADETTLGQAGFQVYAFMHAPNANCNYEATPYMNKKVTYDTEENAWGYSGHAYWPATNELDFVAYGLNASASEISKTKIEFSVDADISSHKDLLVALSQLGQKYVEADAEGETGTATTGNDGTVDFTFSHMLSRIGFSLVTKNNNAIPVTVKQVNLVGNFYPKGTVDLLDSESYTLTLNGQEVTASRPVISVTGDEGGSNAIAAVSTTYKLLGTDGTFTSVGSKDGVSIYDNSMLYYEYLGEEGKEDDTFDDDEFRPIDFGADTEAEKKAKAQADANETNRYMMIIPVDASVHAANLKVIYCLPGAQTFDEITIPLTDVNFEAGKSYDFKFKVSTAGISFDVEVEGWDVTGEDRDVIKLN